jgi:hypothetical protein
MWIRLWISQDQMNINSQSYPQVLGPKPTLGRVGSSLWDELCPGSAGRASRRCSCRSEQDQLHRATSAEKNKRVGVHRAANSRSPDTSDGICGVSRKQRRNEGSGSVWPVTQCDSFIARIMWRFTIRQCERMMSRESRVRRCCKPHFIRLHIIATFRK